MACSYRAGTGIAIQGQTIYNRGVVKVVAGSNIRLSPPYGTGSVVISAIGTGGTVDGVQAGPGIAIDNTDPSHPVISSTGVLSITGADGITVSGPAQTPTLSTVPVITDIFEAASYIYPVTIGDTQVNWGYSQPPAYLVNVGDGVVHSELDTMVPSTGPPSTIYMMIGTAGIYEVTLYAGIISGTTDFLYVYDSTSGTYITAISVRQNFSSVRVMLEADTLLSVVTGSQDPSHNVDPTIAGQIGATPIVYPAFLWTVELI